MLVDAAWVLHQVAMTPGFDNPTVRDNTDPIRNANGAKTMGDHAQDTLFALGLWGSYKGSFSWV